MNFNVFWKWLQIRSRKIDTLDRKSFFKIKVPINAQAGLITSKQKSVFPFTFGDAMRTWDRYHALQQAETYLKRQTGLSSKKDLEQMASCYAKPDQLVQNWQDHPEPYQCAPWIAAAIRDFLADKTRNTTTNK